jgi:AsmA protein
MKTFLKILAGLVVLAIIAVLLLPLLVSVDDIALRVTSGVEETTGRQLTLGSEGSLRVLPSLALELNDVRLANMPGGSRPDMAVIERLDVHIPWLSLLSGELDIDRFVINNPDILLERNADGVANWEDLTGAPAGEEPPPGQSGALPEGFDLRLGEVGIYGGTVVLLDAQAGSEQRLEELDLVLGLPSLREALTVEGSVKQRGEVFRLNTTLSTPAAIIGGEDFDVEVALESRLLNLNYAGSITGDGVVAGSLQVVGDSVKEILAWQGQPLDAGQDAFNRFELTGDIEYADDTLAIDKLVARLDALALQGQGRVRLGEVPRVSANLDLGMLDLNPYLPAVSESPAAGESQAAGPVTWDDTPLDLSGLKSVDADVTVRSSGLRARDIELGRNAFRLALEGGLMTLSMSEFLAYEGNGEGSVRLDARGKPYRLNTGFKLGGIQALPLLRDAVGFDKLSGTGGLNWELATAGISQKQFVAGLDGDLGFRFSDGAVQGANIAALVRSAEGLLKGDVSRGLDVSFDEAEKTDFSELGGTLRFSKGVGRNDDLVLSSPLLRVRGEGTVDLPAARLDYGINARLVQSIEGQGGGKSKGVAIPVRIKGPFHDVKFKPDVSKAAEEKVKDTLKDELLKRFGGGRN